MSHNTGQALAQFTVGLPCISRCRREKQKISNLNLQPPNPKSCNSSTAEMSRTGVDVSQREGVAQEAPGPCLCPQACPEPWGPAVAVAALCLGNSMRHARDEINLGCMSPFQFSLQQADRSHKSHAQSIPHIRINYKQISSRIQSRMYINLGHK